MRFLFALILFFYLFSPELFSEELPGKIRKSPYSDIDSLIRAGYAAANVHPDSGLRFADKAAEMAGLRADTLGRIDVMILYGGIWYIKSRYLLSINSYLEAASLSKSKGDAQSLAIAYERISMVLLTLNQLEQAAFYLENSWENARKVKDTSNIILLHLNEGWRHQALKQARPALNNYYFGFYLAYKTQNFESATRALRLIGSFHVENRALSSAYIAYAEALKLAKQTGQEFEIGTIYSHLAYLKKLENDYAAALVYDQEAARIRKSVNQQEHYLSSLLNICDDYIQLGQYNLARKYLDRGLKILGPGNYYFQVYAYRLEKTLEEKNGNYQRALIAMEKYAAANDSLNAQKNKQEIAIIQTREQLNEISQKNNLLEYQNAVQELQIKNSNRTTALYLIIIIIVLTLMSLFVWLYYKTKKSRETLRTLVQQLDREMAERKQIEQELRISEASYRFLADHSPDLIIHVDGMGMIVYISPSVEKALGYSMDELNGGISPLVIIHPEYRDAMSDLYGQMIETRRPTLLTYEALAKDGSKFWVESLTNPIFDKETGTFQGSISVVRNIEERVKYEARLAQSARQKEILLREIHHRVKNNFAILTGVMNLQKVSADNPELTGLVNDLHTRIRSMSLVHELLYRNENLDVIPFDVYLLQLTQVVAAGNRSKPVRMLYDLDPCTLDIEIVLPLGLVVTEILTNAFKYAFTESAENTLTMELKATEHSSSGAPVQWHLTIRDNGKGLPDGFTLDNAHTLGSQIVRMLVEQIDGSVEARNDGGAFFEINFLQKIERSGSINLG